MDTNFAGESLAFAPRLRTLASQAGIERRIFQIRFTTDLRFDDGKADRIHSRDLLFHYSIKIPSVHSWLASLK